MIHKRPFVDDDSYEVACKHPRHLEHIDQLAPVAFLDDAHLYSATSGKDDDGSYIKCRNVASFANESVDAVSNEDNNLESSSGSFPQFLWINNGNLEADNLSFFPAYFDHGQALLQPEEVFSSFNYPFRKPVSIGPEHQVFVPEWEVPKTSLDLGKSIPQVALAQSSCPSVIVDDDNEERLIGACLIPMPETDAPATHCFEDSKIDCSCLDQASVECVKLHIMEGRQKLRENLGDEIFEGIGFSDMGEDVAKKWTEEEEQVFQDVVQSNPASLGKNFWHHLSVAFSSRTKRELVSYYFNVFMLRKRTEQNRFDPLNIDSDNDEWQRNEAGMADEDEDSAVESLNGQDFSAYYNGDHTKDCSEHIVDEDDYDFGASEGSADVQRVSTDDEYEGDLDCISEAQAGISNVDCGYNSGFEHKGIPSNKGSDLDVEDDSCTSYDYQRENADSCGPVDIMTDGRHSNQD